MRLLLNSRWKQIICLLFLSSFSFIIHLQAADQVEKLIDSKAAEFSQITALQAFKLFENNDLINDEILDEKIFLDVNRSILEFIESNAPQELILEIPFADNQSERLKMTKVEVLSNEFNVYRSSKRDEPFVYNTRSFYWGIVDGKPNSLIAISVFKDHIAGLIYFDGKTYTIGQLKNNSIHVLYQEQNIVGLEKFECMVETDDIVVPEISNSFQKVMTDPLNCVKVHLEADNDLFLDKGSVVNTTDYVVAMYNVVSMMYFNEQINTSINELIVWDTVDPYSGGSSSARLSAFTSTLNGNYNGDLAHLLSLDGGGGVAYVDVICAATNGTAYSGIGTTYNDLPLYSWTIDVVTHEMGHNLGSLHTHSCVWNGDNTSIDDCGPVAGYSTSCAGNYLPPNGGTVMSYCHLVSVGKDLSLGFGPQPGDLIRNRVYNAACLSACFECPDIGAPCDDGLACTTGETIGFDCTCRNGTYMLTDCLDDCDGDGVTDCIDCEPTDSLIGFVDDDGDGVCNNVDICPGSDDNIDTDNDSIPDGCDVCQGYDDAIDTDNDGIPDGCDTCPLDQDNDIDNDGLCADVDPCPFSLSDICYPFIPCASVSNTSSYEYIESVTIDTTTNNSGNNGGYADFSNSITIELTKGDSYALTLIPGFPGTVYNEYWNLWIDYNVNGIFEAGEIIFSASSDTLINGNFTVPLTAVSGTNLLRIKMDYSNSTSTDPCGSYTYGETEDYSVLISDCSDTNDIDSDGDGICDASDICDGFNDLNDDDNDNVPNGCDLCEGFDDSIDADNDGVADACDSCNGFDDQADSDNDGIADGCDSCPNDPDNDIDNDGLCADVDPCPSSPGLCYPFDPCESVSGTSSFEHLESVILDTATNISGNNGGYADFTGTLFMELLKGDSYNITLTPGFSSTVYNEYWNVWIDFDYSGTFDAGEIIFSAYSNSLVSGTITIPPTAVTGHNIMRVKMDYSSSSSDDPCGSYTYGETEDYAIIISDCVSDMDSDGVCDEDDLCEGFDDNIDLNNNQIPDGCDPEFCPSSIVLNNNPEINGIYHAADWISSSSKIKFTSGGDVFYRAGTSYISLENGFEAEIMRNFNAEIMDCY